MFLTRFNAFLRFSSRRKSHIRREVIKIFRHDETSSFFQHDEMNDIRFQSSKNLLTIVQDFFFCEIHSTSSSSTSSSTFSFSTSSFSTSSFSTSLLVRSHRFYFVMIFLFFVQILHSYDHIVLILSRFFFSFTHTITSLLFCHHFSSLSIISSQSSLFNQAFQSFFFSVSCFAHRNSDLQHETLIFNSKLCFSTRILIYSIVTTKKSNVYCLLYITY